MSAPLPEFWTEQVDGKGRTYYSNHKTQTTTWEVSLDRTRVRVLPVCTYLAVSQRGYMEEFFFGSFAENSVRKNENGVNCLQRGFLRWAPRSWRRQGAHSGRR